MLRVESGAMGMCRNMLFQAAATVQASQLERQSEEPFRALKSLHTVSHMLVLTWSSLPLTRCQNPFGTSLWSAKSYMLHLQLWVFAV